jgi:hypothetical protein
VIIKINPPYSDDHIKHNKMGRAYITYGRQRGAYRGWVRKPEKEAIWKT